MRSDSELPVVVGGTLAIHALLIVALDIINVVVIVPDREPEKKPVEVEIVPVKVKLPPPPPPPKVQARVEPQQRPEAQVKPRTRERIETREPPRPPPPPEQPINQDSGGAPVVKYEGDILAGGKVPVAIGRRTTEHVGRGGKGTGAGAGSGAGPAPEVAAPMSIATIKTRARPKGDHSYFNAGRDYPAAARQAGIEGMIRVKLIVDAKGKVRSATLLNKLGYGLDELALGRSRTIEFEPAKDTDDKPVASIVIWDFNMTLPK